MAEEYSERVVFIGISNRDTVAAGKAYRDALNVPYPLANAPRVWELYDTSYQPVTVLIGADGAVSERIEGPVEGETLAAALDRELRR